MRKPIQIGSIKIAETTPPLVIAEIGINHNGSLAVAKEMVDSAKRAGCQCIKHQTHIVDDEMSDLAKTVIPGNSDISIYEIMASCALSEDEEYELKKYVEQHCMVFLSTPFSRAAANRLNDLGVVAFKIGSGECNNLPLVKHIAGFGKPIFLSTGMNDMESVQKTVEVLDDSGVDYALLHTTNLYPTPSDLVRLGGMVQLMQQFPNVCVGLSDHTLNNNACLAATALGAAILERHFTDSYARSGPDIPSSMDEEQLRQLLIASREIKSMLGGDKGIIKEEDVTRRFAFATVVAGKNIRKGEVFSEENLWVKRPGTGEIPAGKYFDLLGSVANRDILCNQHLSWDMVETNQ